jgi:23S rRNA (cytosine1962-C5)-methyltransferase
MGAEGQRAMQRVTLGPGREKLLRRRHPWIFAGAIARAPDLDEIGATVEILGSDGRSIGVGAWSPRSQIRVRVWSFDAPAAIDRDFLAARIARSIARRGDRALSPERACRLVHAESDGIPGLIVDRYGDFLVCQFLAAGVERFRADIVAVLAEQLAPRGIYERSDVDVRAKEGLAERTGVLYGEEPPELVEIDEDGVRFLVDLRHGHKTGFYLDQRENRALVTRYAAGAEVLNAFCYTGGFGVRALLGGARRVTQIDTSREALELAARSFCRNGLDIGNVETLEDDVFHVLRRFRDARRGFDLIVLDPPKFAATASQLDGARRGYKDINLLALKLLRPGGVLFTFSCSGHVGAELFDEILADATYDAGRFVQVIGRLGPPDDHPVAISFPEGRYLKGLILRAE